MVKATGIVRRIDELGRFVIPIEIRRVLGIEAHDPVEVFVDGDRIILRRYAPGCVFCGEADETVVHVGKRVCVACARRIAGQIGAHVGVTAEVVSA